MPHLVYGHERVLFEFAESVSFRQIPEVNQPVQERPMNDPRVLLGSDSPSGKYVLGAAHAARDEVATDLFSQRETVLREREQHHSAKHAKRRDGLAD
jgi:hypothetical protein